MASDSHDSHRKHSRSSSNDDSPEKSKRHKHRHHRHHRRHRHHHRHSSSKHGDAKKDEIEVVNREEVVEEVTKPAPLVDYDDMEEGEIVDDEGVPGAEVDSFDKKVGSDVESGEFKAGDDSYMSVDTDLENPESNHNVTRNDKSGKSKKYLKSPRSDRSGSEGKEDGSHSHHDEFPVSDRVANGDLTRRSRKGESRSHTGHESPLKERSKEKDHVRTKSKHALELMEVDEDDLRGRRDSYSLKVRDDRHEARYRSPSHGRYHLETSDRSRSKSPDRKKERERSQSIAHERYSKTRHHNERDEKLYDNGKVGYEMDGEKDSRAGKDYRSNGGEKVKDKGGERSSSYHRSSLHEGKHEDGDSKDNETEEKMYRDKKRVEPEPIKERSERDRDRIRSRDYERERDFVRDREIHREVKNDIDRNRDRGGSRDRDQERDRERERRREKDRGRSRDRDLGRERRRDDSTSMYKDRDAERERDKERDRSRKSEMDRGRDRYSGSDRHRDKARDDEDDRSSRYHKFDDRDDVYSNRDRRRGYDEAEYFKDRKMKHDPYEDKATKDDSLKENEDAMNGDDDDKDTLELKPAEPEEDDIDRIKEESRRRREAILQKYKAKQSQQQQAVPQVSKDEELTKQPSLKLSSASTGQKENNGAKGDANKNSVDDTSLYLGKSAPGNDSAAAERNTVMLGEGSPKSERSNDMFCDDIFGDSPAGVRKMGKGDGLPLERSGLNDNWDDPEGYYSFRFGEVLDSRYEITAAHGKGVFSTVVRAKDLKAGSGDPEEVAIKIIRNNETMLKAGTEELVILKKLVGADPDDRRHCVRYLSNFKYRNHLCIVFESLHMNLREVLKKFGRNIGLKLTAVRTYAKQLFIALKHLRNCGVLHCDIKPDNMLVNESKNVLKLCDFGNAMFAGKNEITPYLVSRFYRAPEIILGLTYDHPMDIWSVGCCLYELYTGKVLFPGPSNNDMLRLHMELKGPFPKKMLRKGAFIEQHFDQDLNFLALEEDPVTKKTLRKVIVNIKPKDVGNIIRGFSGEDPKMLANFKDLLEKIFVLDPDKRLTVSQALNHPFITASEFRC
ncbi:serine/threonine-protein kinase prpf4B-like [Chenopodium quinoa]|uniref:serine/threonine-protein kinase prpf4B-like n=1 Tax=Chenopodium quinoa TaxID=63459 RepID=UPI000B776DAE|nr:serine/threonine-protein kinase prpf4B-like [Chenopodium quinoa]